MIISHVRYISECWPHSHATVYVCVTFPACAAKPTWKSARGIYVSFSVLITASFPNSHCWHCLSSSTHFHLAANSFPQSQMELQPNTAQFECGFPICPIHPICTLIKWESLNIIKWWLFGVLQVQRSKRNTGERILSCFFFKLYASSQSDWIT